MRKGVLHPAIRYKIGYIYYESIAISLTLPYNGIVKMYLCEVFLTLDKGIEDDVKTQR